MPRSRAARAAFRLLVAAAIGSLAASPARAQPLDLPALARRIQVGPTPATDAPTFADARARAAGAAPAWAAFRSRHPGWAGLWWEEGGHAPQRATGPALAVPGLGPVTRADVAAAAWACADFLGEVIGVPRGELRLGRTFWTGNCWLIGFHQEHRGMRVLGSEVEARLAADGRLVAFGVETFPGLALEHPGPPRRPEAIRAAARAGLPDAATPTVAPAIHGPFVLPGRPGRPSSARVVWQVTAADPALPVPWRAWVDAADGRLVGREPLADFEDLTGTVTGTVHPAVLAAPVSRPFLHQHLAITSHPSEVTATVTSDVLGEYAHDLEVGSASATVAATLDGPVIEVLNAAGPEAAYLMPEPGGFPAVHDVAWSDSNSTLAERDAFHHVNLVFEHVAAIDDALGAVPGFRDGYSKLVCSVNLSGTCNASYSFLNHSLKFYEANFGCLNTAEIPRVVYHEWGHSRSFEQYEIAGANLFLGEGPSPSQLKEALADITALYFFGESTMPKLSGVGVERDADNAYVYPDDYNALGTAHDQSQILSGALWDLRENLIATHGAEAGKRLAEELFHVAQYGGADHSSSIAAWVEFLLDLLIADDDDADLANGTPNFADIAAAFQAHGIWPTALGTGPDPADAHAQVALVIDRSGSMGLDNPTRLARAKDAANAFVALMGDADRVGVSNFDHQHEPLLDHPLVPLTPGNRTSLENLIESFDEEGGATSVGLGLQRGQVILDPGLAVEGAPPVQFILLLSDGEENTPPWAMDEVALLPATTRVYTAFLGSDAEGEALMEALAQATGGVFLDAPDNQDLLRTYLDLYALIMEREMILAYVELVNPAPSGPGAPGAGAAAVSRVVCVEPGTREAQFLGAWTGPDAGGSVELIDPDGVRVDAGTIRRYPGGSLVSHPRGENLRIRGPRAGRWTMNVRATGGPAGPVEVQGFCLTDSDVTMTARGERVPIDPLRHFHALVVDLADARDNAVAEPILGAAVTATSGPLAYTLRDDGMSHDGAAGDGRYGAAVSLRSDTASTVFRIEAAFTDGGLACRRLRSVNLLPTRGATDVGAAAASPAAPALLAGVPNPARAAARVRFVVPHAGDVRVAIHDVQGREVRVLVDARLPAGTHDVTWDGRARSGAPAGSGVYFVRLVAPGGTAWRRLSLVR